MSPKYTKMRAFLREGIERTGRSKESFAQDLGYRSVGIFARWLDGRDLPALEHHQRIAELLHLDVRLLALAWVIDSEPTLEEPMNSLLRLAELNRPPTSGSGAALSLG